MRGRRWIGEERKRKEIIVAPTRERRGDVAGIFWSIQKYQSLHVGLRVTKTYKMAMAHLR